MVIITWRDGLDAGSIVLSHLSAQPGAPEEEVRPVFFDAQSPLFARDGVSPELVRAGEPRLVVHRHEDDRALATAPATRREPLFRRLLRPVAS